MKLSIKRAADKAELLTTPFSIRFETHAAVLTMPMSKIRKLAKVNRRTRLIADHLCDSPRSIPGAVSVALTFFAKRVFKCLPKLQQRDGLSCLHGIGIFSVFQITIELCLIFSTNPQNPTVDRIINGTIVPGARLLTSACPEMVSNS